MTSSQKLESGILRCLDGFDEIIQVPIVKEAWPTLLSCADSDRFMAFTKLTSRNDRLVYTEVAETVFNKLLERHKNGG